MIVDTHVHVFTDDRKKYPQIGGHPARRVDPVDSPRSGRPNGRSRPPETPDQRDGRGRRRQGDARPGLFRLRVRQQLHDRCGRRAPGALYRVVVLDPMDPARPTSSPGSWRKKRVTACVSCAGGCRRARSESPRRSRCGSGISSSGFRSRSTIGSARLAKIRKAMDSTRRQSGVRARLGSQGGAPPTACSSRCSRSRTIRTSTSRPRSTTSPRRVKPAARRGALSKLVDVFGAKRIMWSSNYPAHPQFGDIKARLQSSQKALAFMPEEDRRWIFSETALSLWPSLRG